MDQVYIYNEPEYPSCCSDLNDEFPFRNDFGAAQVSLRNNVQIFT